MEKQEGNTKAVNTGRAKEELLFPFVIAFVFFAGIALVSYVVLEKNLQWMGGVIDLLGIIILAFLMYFYRDPEREIKAEDDDILCPADGKIVGIEEVNNAPGIEGKFIRISIFLNIHNVHIQRMPFSGKITDISVLPGRLLPAFHADAGKKNRQNIYIIKGGITAVVKQIAGVLVHRPVAWVEAGDILKAGDRFGMITFGSRVELFVPAVCRITAVEDDIVYAGTTLLGKMSGAEEKTEKPAARVLKA
ncbi:MAG: phosphatidylserine decarboxylase [Candidatus Firestonebacteria bacterium]